MRANELLNVLDANGKHVKLHETLQGSRLILSSYGGRVLGLFSPNNDDNFYWTHPALASVETAGKFYASTEWHNSGGDRTWISPEVDVFFPEFPDTSVYRLPRQLEPGHYEIENESECPRFVNKAIVALSRSQQDVPLEITKSWSSAANPLRYERLGKELAEKVDYAGYTQHTNLRFTQAGTDSMGPVGLWNLVQLPHGGEFLAPTYNRIEPKVYFGTVPLEDLRVTEHLIRYCMWAKGIQKIGIRAVSTPGRVGYLYQASSGWVLVIRNFFVNPSGEYLDVPWNDSGETGDLGYSIQACNVNNNLGSFGELEYHVPAIGFDTGRDSSDDIAQIWAFRGSESGVRAVARMLLSPEI
jgi:hypothetical protein